MSFAAFLQVFVATVFLISATTKFFTQGAFRRTLTELGLPHRIAAAGAVGVPVAESLAAILILMEPLRLVGVALTLVLAAAFAWSNWRAISAAGSIECNCFGNLTTDRFGTSSVVRALIIAGAGLYLALHRGPTRLEQAAVTDWLAACTVSVGLILLHAYLSAFSQLAKALKTR